MYRSLISKILIQQNNLYNSRIDNLKINLKSTFSSFGAEKNIKLIRNYKLAWLFINQKPLLKNFKFNFLKKKILKQIIFGIDLNKVKKDNYFLYLSNFFFHFFNIYYQKKLKGKCIGNRINIKIDNPNYFIKNYDKRNQRFHFNLYFFSKNKRNINLNILSNLLIITQKNKLYKNEIFKSKK